MWLPWGTWRENQGFLQRFFCFPFRLLLSAHHQPQNVTTARPSSPHPSREKCPEIGLLRWKSPTQQMTVRSSSEKMMEEVREAFTAKQACLGRAQSCGKGSQCRLFKEVCRVGTQELHIKPVPLWKSETLSSLWRLEPTTPEYIKTHFFCVDPFERNWSSWDPPPFPDATIFSNHGGVGHVLSNEFFEFWFDPELVKAFTSTGFESLLNFTKENLMSLSV